MARSTTLNSFGLYEHPWLAMLAVMAVSILSSALSSTLVFKILGLPDDLPEVAFLQQWLFHALTVFFLVPFVLCLANGKRTFRQYLEDIGLSRVHPFVALLLLALFCDLILALCQAAVSFV